MFSKLRIGIATFVLSILTGGLLVAPSAQPAAGSTRTVHTTRVAHATQSKQAKQRATEAKQRKRVVKLAKRYVGKVRYRYGGASPKRGFDCSGFTKYVYKKAKLGKLPHNAEGQRDAKRVHRISAKKARPGDLVFYGKPAYHVAIYAGSHRVYHASTPGSKVKKQKIHGKVTYGRFRK